MSWVIIASSSDRLNLYENNFYTLNTGNSNQNPFQDSSGNTINCLHDGKWHHFVVTFGSSIVKLYIDGEYKGTALNFKSPATTNIKTIRLGGGYNGGHTYDWNGMLNDFRIYDHALSPMEVKQISQGLILHYPLNNNGFGQKNLHKNSDTITSTWSVNQGTVSNGIVTITPSSGSDRRIYQMPANGGWSWESNKTYTASIDARSPDGAILIFYPYGAGSMSKSYTVTSQWKRYSFTFTATQSGTASMTYHVSQTSGVTLQLKHPKLELGQKATPWCFNETDKLFTTLNLNNNIEYDCSGFNNNAEKININYDSDTPKYDVSSVFSASPSVIKIPNSNYAIQGSQNMTISVWAYKEDWSQYAQRVYSCTEGGGLNIQLSSNNMQWAVNVYTDAEKTSHKYASSSPDLYIRVPRTDFSSGWHMFTWVYTTSGTLLYVDGVLKQSKTGTSYGLYFHSTAPLILGGQATPTNYSSPYLDGKLSDFRIYVTALSVEDILALYKNSVYIDNEGNLYGVELREV